MHIAERARRFSGEALTNLHQFITVKDLHESYEELNKYSSAGIDGEDWFTYGPDRKVLNPIYETEFRDFSYGFRPERSAHDAITIYIRK